ncbi:hypothetical protein Tsp_09680 [Trichinella spiralis]|nr:hypothetical protein Tsp_09680 [Trichinella spiralis]
MNAIRDLIYSREGSVRNAYISLTEEERQYVSRKHYFTCI